MMNRQCGFTYLGLLFGIAFFGLMLAGTGEVWQLTARREREEQLLFIGREFSHALAAYHDATPDGQPPPPSWPRKLEDLVEDRRLPMVRRHLRRIYVDPMTGTTEWGLVKAGADIVAIHSLSAAPPLKQAGFRAGQEDFAGAQTYAQWIFKPAQQAVLQVVSQKTGETESE